MSCYREPSLEEILSDPIIKAVINADGVDARDLNAMLRRVAHKRQSAQARATESNTPRSGAPT
jgi:hypothetical protein